MKYLLLHFRRWFFPAAEIQTNQTRKNALNHPNKLISIKVSLNTNIKQILLTVVRPSRTHVELHTNKLTQWHYSPPSQMSRLFVTKPRWRLRFFFFFFLKRTQMEPTHTHNMRTCLTQLPHTIGVSECQSSVWKAAVITVKAGHQRDARLTLLTCLHQHTGRGTILSRHQSKQSAQFTHSTPLCTMLFVVFTVHKNPHAVLMKNGDPLNPGGSPFTSYWFHLLKQLPAWRNGDQNKGFHQDFVRLKIIWRQPLSRSRRGY